MPPAGFKLTFPGSERPQTHALDHAASGIDLPSSTLRMRQQVSPKLYNIQSKHLTSRSCREPSISRKVISFLNETDPVPGAISF